MSERDDDISARDVHGLDELLGAYALDAVDGDERRRVEEYLSINPRAAAEVAAHREVATMLAFTGMDAPEQVWLRIEAELESSESAPPPGPELAKVLSFAAGAGVEARADDRGRRRFAAAAPWLAGIAAAAAIAVVAVGVIDRGGDGSLDPMETAFEAALSDGDSRSAELVASETSPRVRSVIDRDGHGYIDASPLPALASDQTYQLWGVLAGTGDVVSIGILGPNPELEMFTIESGVSALAITIESSPGVVSDGNPDGAFAGEFS